MAADRERRPWRLAAAWLLGLGPLFYLSYGLANAWASSRAQVVSMVFDWERAIPFWAWTIFPYWTINAFYALSLFLGRSRHEVNRHGLRLLTAQLVAVTCFVLWPLQFSFGQPAVQGAPAFLFEALRGFDKPFNQAPSLHIALAVILWDWYRRRIRPAWARVVLHVWTLAICGSVLTTYQHHFIDIPTGALLGVVCVWLWPLERQVALPAAWRWTPDAGRRRLALIYATGALMAAAAGIGIGGAALWLMWPAVSLFVVALCYLGLGTRGFAMDRQGRMAWPARWLLGPYRAAARLNAWLWTRRLPAGAEVQPGLWLGRIPDEREWIANGRPALVGLSAELQLPAAALTRCVPMLDLVPPTPAQLLRAMHAIEAARHDAGPAGRVWVCCALGFSRSAGTLVGWLGQQGALQDLQQAEAVVRRARPQIVLRPAWRALIAEVLASRPAR